MHTDVYLQAVWPNRLILPLSSAADPRQVSEIQQFEGKIILSRCGNLNQEGFCVQGSAQ